jgi:hypothetical protein
MFFSIANYAYKFNIFLLISYSILYKQRMYYIVRTIHYHCDTFNITMSNVFRYWSGYFTSSIYTNLQRCAKGLSRRDNGKEKISVSRPQADKASSATHLAFGPHSLHCSTENSSRRVPSRSHKTITFDSPGITEASHFFILLVAGQKAQPFWTPL